MMKKIILIMLIFVTMFSLLTFQCSCVVAEEGIEQPISVVELKANVEEWIKNWANDIRLINYYSTTRGEDDENRVVVADYSFIELPDMSPRPNSFLVRRSEISYYTTLSNSYPAKFEVKIADDNGNDVVYYNGSLAYSANEANSQKFLFLMNGVKRENVETNPLSGFENRKVTVVVTVDVRK